MRNILSFLYKIISQFVKAPSDTLLRYFQHVSPIAITIISTIHHHVKFDLLDSVVGEDEIDHYVTQLFIIECKGGSLSGVPQN
jgi:hypothetical protein